MDEQETFTLFSRFGQGAVVDTTNIDQTVEDEALGDVKNTGNSFNSWDGRSRNMVARALPDLKDSAILLTARIFSNLLKDLAILVIGDNETIQVTEPKASSAMVANCSLPGAILR